MSKKGGAKILREPSNRKKFKYSRDLAYGDALDRYDEDEIDTKKQESPFINPAKSRRCDADDMCNAFKSYAKERGRTCPDAHLFDNDDKRYENEIRDCHTNEKESMSYYSHNGKGGANGFIGIPSSHGKISLTERYLYRNLNIEALYHEIHLSAAEYRQEPILHNFKNSQVDKRKLYKWTRFSMIIEPFISSIHYEIQNDLSDFITGTLSGKANRLASGRDMISQNRAELKKSLCLSTMTPDEKSLRLGHDPRPRLDSLLAPIESVFDTYLMRLTLFKESTLLFFTWRDAPDFVFFMAFTRNSLPGATWQLPEDTVVILYRDDIARLEKELLSDQKEDPLDNTNNNNTTKKKKKMDSSISSTESLSGRPVTENGLIFVSSIDADGIEENLLIRSACHALKIESLTYETSGYIKK